MTTRVIPVDPDQPEAAAIAEAAALLRAGGLVAFPTETVYGLGADAANPRAVARIFAAKGRPASDPLIVHVLGLADLDGWAAELPAVARRLAEAFWPGPLTLVLPRGPRVPDLVAAGLDSVAVRAPAHPVARALLAATGRPIAAPSANPFGRTSPTTAAHVLADLGGRIDLLLDGGPARLGLESTVVDCRTLPPRVLRPGGVTLEALRALVPGILAPGQDAPDQPSSGGPVAEAPLRSPGLLTRHYAPRARLVLVQGPPEAQREALAAAGETLLRHGLALGLLVAEEDGAALAAALPGAQVLTLGPRGADAVLAAGLFAALRALDEGGVAIILAADFGEAGLALAIRDRLRRAAEGRLVLAMPGATASNAAAILALAAGP